MAIGGGIERGNQQGIPCSFQSGVLLLGGPCHSPVNVQAADLRVRFSVGWLQSYGHGGRTRVAG